MCYLHRDFLEKNNTQIFDEFSFRKCITVEKKATNTVNILKVS